MRVFLDDPISGGITLAKRLDEMSMSELKSLHMLLNRLLVDVIASEQKLEKPLHLGTAEPPPLGVVAQEKVGTDDRTG